MMSRLLEPFQYGFMIEALIMGVVIGATCAVLSCFLVLRGWSLMGDAIAHAVLPGIVLAYVARVPLLIGAFASGFLCAVTTGFIKAHSRVKEDTVLGVVFTGLFAVGLVLFSKVRTDIHLDHILFGNILGVSRAQLFQSIGIGALTIAIVVALRRDLALLCFDTTHARAIGLRTNFLYYLLLALLALTTVLSLNAVGIILVVAMLVTPGCVGYLLCDRLDQMLITAVVTATISSATGVYLSYFIGGATGPCIVLVQALIFAGAMCFAPRQGWVARWKTARNQRASAAIVR